MAGLMPLDPNLAVPGLMILLILVMLLLRFRGSRVVGVDLLGRWLDRGARLVRLEDGERGGVPL